MCDCLALQSEPHVHVLVLDHAFVLPSGHADVNKVWMWAALLAGALSVMLQTLTGISETRGTARHRPEPPHGQREHPPTKDIQTTPTRSTIRETGLPPPRPTGETIDHQPVSPFRPPGPTPT
jgi:hypothetical protein